MRRLVQAVRDTGESATEEGRQVNTGYATIAALAIAAVVMSDAGFAAGAATGREPIMAAAAALGGIERIEAVKNITLIGYGQYAYMFGGGNITGSPYAPQKYQAANDLKRIYDLQNDRFGQLERRNFLFPFAATFGHSYAPVNQTLDGDIAFDTAPDGKVSRVTRWIETSHQIDGVHMRRMWMLNNPVALIRAALDPATRVGTPADAGAVTTIGLTLKEGDKLTLAIDRKSKLPAWVRWANPQSNLGQVTLTTYFTGYAPFAGLQLPLGYRTTMDWRNIDYLKIYVDNYLLDSNIVDLAAPAAVRAEAEPQQAPVDVKVTPVAKGMWRLSPYGGTVFEFKDHLAIFELGGNQQMAQADVDAARKLVPGKPLTQYIPSHHHFDHTAGLRVAVAAGLTVISKRGNEGIFREMAAHPSPDFPDALEMNKKPMKFMPMPAEHLRLSDSSMTVDLYWVRSNIHMADAVFAYVPASKVMVEGDIGTAAVDYQFWADSYMDNIEYYKLDVETISPVHMQIMKHAELIEMIKGGVRRARERCASELAKGNYFPGCPVQSSRY
jgi:glyoxylase-like metal-dependent hydrolase (beta-lactamase superfamily II)